MVGALGAGASVADAMENAMREPASPLRPQLEEVIGRIRLGDDPPAAYRGLAQRVPLETFLLFCSALAVQSETGGSLAPTLPASAARSATASTSPAAFAPTPPNPRFPPWPSCS